VDVRFYFFHCAIACKQGLVSVYAVIKLRCVAGDVNLDLWKVWYNGPE
jgi:hypothetical protein